MFNLSILPFFPDFIISLPPPIPPFTFFFFFLGYFFNNQALIMADFGPRTSFKIVDALKADIRSGVLKSGPQIKVHRTTPPGWRGTGDHFGLDPQLPMYRGCVKAWAETYICVCICIGISIGIGIGIGISIGAGMGIGIGIYMYMCM